MDEDQRTAKLSRGNSEALATRRALDEILPIEELKEAVPENPETDFPADSAETDTKIQNENTWAVERLPDTRAALISLYYQTEQVRIRSHKEVLSNVLKMAKASLLWFNIIISVVGLAIVSLCFILKTPEPMQHLLELAKYYIGAVLVEIIGLVSVIVSSVYSSRHYKIIEKAIDESETSH